MPEDIKLSGEHHSSSRGTGTTGIGSGAPVVPVPEPEPELAGEDEVGDAPALGVAEPVGGEEHRGVVTTVETMVPGSRHCCRWEPGQLRRRQVRVCLLDAWLQTPAHPLPHEPPAHPGDHGVGVGVGPGVELARP
jgi:hypothetical protein